ncbi:M61 family metallopeptidase [Chitinibacter bivalviorum]|uniref:M61 family metallopeptidase n=1 Tax=Chitinibacter bivalviorum TaxID=2739434 RepID=A0A7H9BG02_9NEIS|nr:M61 family metallopeptidase [Chitinibacter bivalviorum]QLG87549.1 M61 family metallopeptidase [Chitinibacter bivalviorum]
MPIHYSIEIADAAAHLFAIELTIDTPDPKGQILELPVWIPGSYLIREFARNIVQIAAFSKQKTIPIEKLSKSSWRIAPTTGPLTIRYEVYAFDLSVRGAYLDQTRAFFNGTSVFLAAKGFETLPCSVQIKADSFSAMSKQWQVATGLCAAAVNDNGFGHYTAQNYDELIDCPVEISDFSKIEFEACGVPHQMVISGRHHADMERLAHDLRLICEYQIRLFGEPAPFNRYVFMTMAVGDGYGGLEHRNSTALICKRTDLPEIGSEQQSDGYRQFLGLCSHEYFHSWNVKRIKPAAYAPYDLQQENYSRLLWAFEGITSYYDDLSLLRCGLITFEQYLHLLAQTATAVERGYGRKRQSLEESSFDTWVKYYRQDENTPNEVVSYYTKGALVALCLDLHIRAETQNQKSLDDVMRALWNQFGRHFDTLGQGIKEHEWETIAQAVTGLDLTAFFDMALRSTTDLPLSNLLEKIGVQSQLRLASNPTDKGGWQDNPVPSACTWGVRTADDPQGVKLTHVLRHGAACAAGLAAGDVVIAINGLKASASQFASLASNAKSGQCYQVHAFRRDELMQFELVARDAIADTWGFCKSKDSCQVNKEMLATFLRN